MELRPYQQRAVDQIRAAWRDHQRICLVIPTGGGKTITAQAATEGQDALWLVHRRELADQAPGRAVTIQSLLASGERPHADVLIADECHHLAPSAEQWHAVAAHYPRILGLTATPQRGDGSPLGDLFSSLIVGASYSELLADGHLVPARVYRPAEMLQGYAQRPEDAWRQHAGDGQGFAYFSRVEQSEKFRAAVYPVTARTISGKTPTAQRDESLAAFRAGSVRVLSNVQVLTEGVDVQEAAVCLIARGCEHQGTYLQMVGRVLRPSPGKDHATVIDLGGVSHMHGLPTEDREYSLDGRAIKSKVESLRVCPECGRTQPHGPDHCVECGFVWPPVKKRARVWGVPLELAQAEAETPKERKIVAWRAKLQDMNDEQRRGEFARLKALAESNGYKPGWAAYQYKIRFGTWPRR